MILRHNPHITIIAKMGDSVEHFTFKIAREVLGGQGKNFDLKREFESPVLAKFCVSRRFLNSKGWAAARVGEKSETKGGF